MAFGLGTILGITADNSYALQPGERRIFVVLKSYISITGVLGGTNTVGDIYVSVEAPGA